MGISLGGLVSGFQQGQQNEANLRQKAIALQQAQIDLAHAQAADSEYSGLFQPQKAPPVPMAGGMPGATPMPQGVAPPQQPGPGGVMPFRPPPQAGAAPAPSPGPGGVAPMGGPPP